MAVNFGLVLLVLLVLVNVGQRLGLWSVDDYLWWMSILAAARQGRWEQDWAGGSETAVARSLKRMWSSRTIFDNQRFPGEANELQQNADN